MKQNTEEPNKRQWALVTGASSGIGAAIATELATHGFQLVLTARRAENLDELAQRLRSLHDIDVRTVTADLAERSAPEEIFEFTQSRGIEIDILINNAGAGVHGEFWRDALASQLAMIQLHCAAVVELTHRFIGPMVERRRGKVLIVATTTLAPAPYLTTYAATKGFDLLFAEGLAEEVRRHGVFVSSLCPGPTRTGMVTELPGEGGHRKWLQPAEVVAARAVSGLLRGKRCIRPSWMAAVVANLPRLLPRATVSGATERYYRPEES
jgi:uncharacterized protein